MTATWGVAIGEWGDALAAYGLFQAQVGTGGLLHVGADPHVAPFLAAQSGVQAVARLALRRRGAYRTLVETVFPAGPVDPAVWLPALAGQARLEAERLVSCVVDWSRHKQAPVVRPEGVTLPAPAREWAQAYLSRLPAGPRLLVQPYSLRAVPRQAHWPHWRAALSTLARTFPGTLLYAGQKVAFRLHGPRVRSVVGRTPSMAHLFALADACDGIVTTSNSLAMWAALRHKPAIVACNAHLLDPGNYFYRFLDVPTSRLLGHADGLEAWEAARSTLCARLSGAR